MPSAAEAAAASIGGQLAASLASGTETISQNQTIVFTQYNRVILPLDGFAFWVRADILSPSALLNSTALNAATINQTQTISTPATTQAVKGSLHYSTVNNQEEAEGFSVNQIVFTSEQEIELLNTVDPKTMFIGEWQGQRFGFSRRNMRYTQGGLCHYTGDAIYPSMATQIIDWPTPIDLTHVVVSNSLPIWLSLSTPALPLYPSFLVPEDILPPWGAVHIDPNGTTALQAQPWFDPNTGSQWQLCTEKVKITTYGVRNAAILDFIATVNAYSLNTDNMGIMNMPVSRDEKQTQAELNIIAQRKSIEFEVSYHQTQMKNVALQYIKSAFIEDVFLQNAA